ncbi:DUF6992 family protein [Balneola sp. MJW-20]|uniref:DUF6992 family protein n=1 Tax=Gracilimonas aurantiaca TaxID=3234185 RepID=UPI003467A198
MNNLFSRSQDLQRSAMYVLGSWATVNIISGAIGTLKSSGSTKYFHQMNAGWNLVNFAIAGASLYSLSTTDPFSLSSSEIFGKMNNLDKFLLLNAGLDLGYIATGAWLWERGLRKGSERLTGYGKSLMMQGGFLLIFDGIFYALHSPLTGQLAETGLTVEIAFNSVRIHF